ncbi:mechanosensitive ion channel domain-containing protein [Chondrinema litorale]|uniref:mechanosensitive ion channel domain-containing protein n=1 Tax=Chondrinema litorale TaxID=2994555 RepID=UPI00254346D9|nr:mechanosensitive ion channel domain-containing protein [Chondrinema litorale]UZR94449.1 mechanosensitive ion channel [Chondrinema litorale]
MKSSYRMWIRRLLPPVEGSVWFIFFLVGINWLVPNSVWSSVAILLIIIVALFWISWFAVKDIVAGIILKTEGTFAVNDRIQVMDVTGQITKLGYRAMVLETDLGETVNIPFSKVSAEMQVKSNPGERIKSHRFEILLKETSTHEVMAQVKNIRQIVFNAPWSSLKKAPQVKLVGEKEGHKRIEIIIYALKVEYFTLIKDYLKTYLKDFEVL